MWTELGSYARKEWRMENEYGCIPTDALKEEFKNVKRRKQGASPNGPIPTKLRLSVHYVSLLADQYIISC